MFIRRAASPLPLAVAEHERLRDGRGLVFRHVEKNAYSVEHALDEFRRLARRWGYG